MAWGPYFASLPVDADGFAYIDEAKWDLVLDNFANWKDNVNAGGKNLSSLGILTFGAAGGVADGSLSAPGLRFASDLDTGIHRSAADTLNLVTGGASRVTVSASGAAVTGGLSVTGSATVGGDVNVGNSSGDTFNTFRLDGFTDTLYLVGDSASGAAVGTSIVLRTAPAGTGVGVDSLKINPNSWVDIATRMGIGGAASNWRIFNVADAARAISDAGAGVGSLGVALGSANTDQGIFMGCWNGAGAEYGWIQSIKAGTSAYPLQLNTAGGGVVTGCPASALADSRLLVNNLHMWVDEGANLLRFRVKYSTGTVKAGSIALA